MLRKILRIRNSFFLLILFVFTSTYLFINNSRVEFSYRFKRMTTRSKVTSVRQSPNKMFEGNQDHYPAQEIKLYGNTAGDRKLAATEAKTHVTELMASPTVNSSSAEELSIAEIDKVTNHRVSLRDKKQYINGKLFPVLENKGNVSVLKPEKAMWLNNTYHGIDLMALPQFKFDPAYRNPCWTERGTLRCLPYFFVIGIKKCGTTELWRKTMRHPDVISPHFKEAQWFARGRFHKSSGDFNIYINRFQRAALTIKRTYREVDGGKMFHPLVTGEGSPSNLHLNSHWRYLPGNERLDEPRYIILDYIQHFMPKAKIIIIFRNPTERLYSDYYHEFGKLRHNFDPSPQHFHELVVKGLQLYKECQFNRTLRSCVYDERIYKEVGIHIQLGIFQIYWKDLLRLFPREQILALQNHELKDEAAITMRIFTFLDLDPQPPLPPGFNVTRVRYSNSRRGKDILKGDMLNETRTMLDDFYRPHNEEMFRLTGDKAFLYTSNSHSR